MTVSKSDIDEEVMKDLKQIAAKDSNFVPGQMQLFERRFKELIIIMQNALENGDHKTVAEEAHSLKSSAYAMGGLKLGLRCQDLEFHPEHATRERLDSLLEASFEFIKYFRSRMEEDDPILDSLSQSQ